MLHVEHYERYFFVRPVEELFHVEHNCQAAQQRRTNNDVSRGTSVSLMAECEAFLFHVEHPRSAGLTAESMFHVEHRPAAASPSMLQCKRRKHLYYTESIQ